MVWTNADGGYPVATVTRGKWGDEYASLRFTEGTGEGSISAKVEAYIEQSTYGEVPHDEAAANARLIAAAPDLVEALAELVALKALKDTDGKTDDYERRQPKAWQAARAALAKAQERL